MQTRYLGSLLAVIETGSIAAAARQQNLTPAAVSQRIAALEPDLGCELLIRSAKSAWPWPICLGLLDDIYSLPQAEARMRARSSAGSLAGRLRVGAISTRLVEIIPPILTRLRETAPELELTVRPGSSADLYERVRNRNLDMALIVRPPFSVAKDVEMRAIRREPLMRLTPPDCSATSLEEAFGRWALIRYDATSWGRGWCRTTSRGRSSPLASTATSTGPKPSSCWSHAARGSRSCQSGATTSMAPRCPAARLSRTKSSVFSKLMPACTQSLRMC